MYVRLVERGAALGANFDRLLQLGSNTPPFLAILKNPSGNVYYSAWQNAAASEKNSVLAAAVTYGDDVELLVTLTSTGVIQTSQSINGGAVTSGAASTAQTLPSLWSTAVLSIGHIAGGVAGGSAHRLLTLVRGADKTIADFRAYWGL